MNRDNPFPDGDESAAAHPDIRDIIGGENPPPGASGIVDDGGGDADPLAGAFRTDGLIAPEPGTVPAADDGPILPQPSDPDPREPPSEPGYTDTPDSGGVDGADEGGE